MRLSNLMRKARAHGLVPSLLYFSAKTPEICLSRIARRVAEGGHDVDETTVRRRFGRSLSNLLAYSGEADLWRIYEASGPKPCLAAEGSRLRLDVADADCLAAAHRGVRDFVQGLRDRVIVT